MKLFFMWAKAVVIILLPLYTFSQNSDNCLELVRNIRDWKLPDKPDWNFEKNGVGNAALFYFGAEHQDDPLQPQFKKIEAAFEKFTPSVVFYEGPDRGIAATDTSTIRLFGESGYVRWLAKKSNIPTVTLEPTIADIYQYLLSKYPQDKVDLYMFSKEASRLHHRKKMNKDQVAEAITEMMGKIGQLTGTNKPLLTTVQMVDSVYHKYVNSEYEWWQLPQSWFDPARSGRDAHFTNDLSELSSSFRNIFMVKLLAREVNSGKRVFAVIGRNHVPLQAPALECAIAAAGE